MSTARILPILERNQYDDFEFDDLQEAGQRIELGQARFSASL